VAHGLFMAGAAELIADPAIDRLLVTDTIRPFRLGANAPRDNIDTVRAASALCCGEVGAIARFSIDNVVSLRSS
jgi:phosphoribosylpyrophosphate synthetase